MNPVRARLLTAEESLRSYRWSSFGEYLKAPARRWEWLRVDWLLGEAGIPQDSSVGRRQFEIMVEERRARASRQPDWRAVRRGWFLGDAQFKKQFKKELLAQMHEGFGAHHSGEEREESREARVERLLKLELKRVGWTKEQLAEWRKGDARKVRVAQRLRKEPTMTLAWIADRLAMGSASTVTDPGMTP